VSAPIAIVKLLVVWQVDPDIAQRSRVFTCPLVPRNVVPLAVVAVPGWKVVCHLIR
jgi:hypothetical protein